MTIDEAKKRIKDSSSQQLIKEVFQKIEELADYNIFINLTKERAMERALGVDEGRIKGELAGVPFAVKDNYLAFGAPTTAASKILENFESPMQATVIERLEAEGAICIGKTNLDAFTHGGSTENSAYGPTKNAFDKERVAGGSSGGSAVAVALGIVPFSLGSDTGGSIRQPASYNGVVGIKPTYGMVSRFGVIAMASGTDCMGVFTNNVQDCETVIDIMSGQDKLDSTTFPDYFEPLGTESSSQRIGLIKDFMTKDVSEGVKECVNNYVDKLRSKGHIVEEVDLPMAEHALAIYYIIVPAEVSSNLARYDGVRYGQRSKSADTLSELYGKTRDEGFETENKRQIMIGSFVLSSGYFDAYYLHAQKSRTLLINEFNKLFEKYDVLIGPVAPTSAFKIGENTNDPIKMYLNDIMTVPASLAGLPAISVPAGLSGGLPVGVQLIGKMKDDARLLNLAKSLETM